jgi:hypothetical protein
MNRTCRTNMGDNLEERERLENLVVDKRIILRRVFK